MAWFQIEAEVKVKTTVTVEADSVEEAKEQFYDNLEFVTEADGSDIFHEVEKTEITKAEKVSD